MNIFVKLLFLVFLAPLTVLAQQEQTVTLVDRVSFSGDVEQVLFVLMTDKDQARIVEATWIAPQEGDDISCVAQVDLPMRSGQLKVLSVIRGTQGEVRSSYREVQIEEVSPVMYLSLSDLRSRFVERRGVFRRLQSDLERNEARLRALQEDADAIAMVSKIVSAEDELGEIKTRLQRVAAAYEGIVRKTNQLKTAAAPLNAQKREFELVRQLGELSTALSTVENQALKKLAGAKGELQDKLALIEDTRGEHIALLEEELARLRRDRQ